MCLVGSGAGAGSGVGADAGSGGCSGAISVAFSGAGSRYKVGILSFIGSILLLKLLRNFFLAQINDPTLFRKQIFNWF